jgi:hypothetical protein
MNAAAPDGAPPQRISAGKHSGKHRTAPPSLGEALKREAMMSWFNDFHGPSVNPGSWVFLQSLFYYFLKKIPKWFEKKYG